MGLYLPNAIPDHSLPLTLGALYLQLQKDVIMCSLQLVRFLQTRSKFRQLRVYLQYLQLQPLAALQQSAVHQH